MAYGMRLHEVNVEIARYPMRCHRCGRADQVRVVAMEPTDESDERYFSGEGALPTMREAPEGLTWERGEDGQPRWVCPECSAREGGAK